MKCKFYIVSVLLLACMASVKSQSNVYDLTRVAARATRSLKHVTEELRERFHLLSYVLNTTIAYRVYEIGVTLVDLQFDEEYLNEIHDKIFSSKSEINLSIQNQVHFCEELSGYITKVHVDLEKNLDNLVIDFSTLQNTLATLDQKYWSTIFNITSRTTDIKHVIQETVKTQGDAEIADVTKYLQKIEDLLENERVGIEACKYDFDNKSIDAQSSVNAVIQYMSPDVN